MTDRMLRSVDTYLAAIYLLDEEGVEPIRARLSERLGHSAPAVSEMIGRLRQAGLVAVDARRIALTPVGRARAETSVRRHRLAERLLVDVIGVDWTVAHNEATRWEQVISDQVEACLVALLGNPATSSMGTPIPGTPGQSPAGRPLDGVGPDQAVRVAQISETLQADGEAIGFLAGHGLAPGATITVAGKSPDGTLTVTVAGQTVAIGASVARQIQVAQIPPTQSPPAQTPADQMPAAQLPVDQVGVATGDTPASRYRGQPASGGGRAGSGRPRPRFRRAHVQSVARLGPRMVRVALTGGDLAGFGADRPAQHIKILFPAPGQSEPPIPDFGPAGLVYPDGAARPPMRTYTPRRFDPGRAVLEVDFVLHGHGPGSAWAARAAAGDAVVVAGPGGGYPIDPDATGRYLLAGDHCALPALATIVESLPAGSRARVYLETAEPGDELALVSDAQVAVTWLHPDDPVPPPGRLLAAAVRDAEIDPDTKVWVACEAAAMRAIRRHLIVERGVDRSRLHTRGYWKLGETDHPDHDTGEEDDPR